MSIYYKKITLSVLLLVFTFAVYGQDTSLSGKVTDSAGKPLEFATIAIEGTNFGTTSDIEGFYSLYKIPVDLK